MYLLKQESLQELFPKTPVKVVQTYIDPLNKTFKEFGFNTALSVRSFLCEVGHESAGFTRIIENLNYSKDGLLKTFPKYFNETTAAQYARNPEKIANRVYANRMGNGPESSGDGWKFRGRGTVQITGTKNYTALATFFGKTIDETITYLEASEGATRSAGWFFSTNRLIDLANIGSVTNITKAINGGTNGLNERLDIFNRSKNIII